MRKIIFLFLTLLPVAALADEGEGHSRFSASLSPRWYHVTRSNYASAFSNNGFDQPSKDQAGLGFLFYWTTATDWQLGFGFGGFSASQDLGTSSASYSEQHYGFYGAKNLVSGKDYDITIGALLGMEGSTEEIFSTNAKGRFDEAAAVIEPSIGFAEKVSKWIKLGVNINYLFPFAESSQQRGDSLAVKRISARALSLGAQVIFGRFQ